MSVKNVLKFADDENVAYVNVRFTDLVGAWHHLTFPIEELSEGSFEDGFGFDGSSLRGWASIHESDMLLVPDPYRHWIDAFMGEKTLCLVADVVDPITKEGYWLDPRGVGRRAESYLKQTGIADTVYFGPEAEFFVFDDVRFHNEGHTAGYSLDNPEPVWNTGG
ncbi:MAG TPA: glutamine synthetase beta-grasp domain-containing protein, partial [Pyrinomonadaceae bacterium]|nr:glutamine synthetase beta-grasp domain-containing protein [Pyrinomonadaceae bacterium]